MPERRPVPNAFSGPWRSRGSRKEPSVRKHEAVHRLIELIDADDSRKFYMGLVGYFIEGQPYAAAALNVDADSMRDLSATDEMFSCVALFPPDRLTPGMVAACGRQRGPNGKLVVAVRLDVHLQDVWLVAEMVAGHAQIW